MRGPPLSRKHWLPLTPRQVHVLKGVALSKPQKVICDELGIAPQTVSYHLAKACHRVGIENDVASITRYCIWRGLIPIKP